MVFKTTIVVEMVALSSGLGYLLLMYYLTIDVQHILATIMILSLIMVSIIELIDVLEKKIASKWIGEVYW
jgi:ABC-type nitrate/sulfonate/bicarbonate transport system permease component